MQTGVEFLRIKSQSEAEALNTRRQHGHYSQDAELRHKKSPSEESGHGDPGCYSSGEGSGSVTETDSVLHKLQAELEEERANSQRICAELAEEMEKHNHVLSLLEEEKKSREDERKEKEVQLQVLQTQLSQVQSQCLEMQQYKEEKEKINKEVAELRKRLQEEDAEKRFSEEVSSSAALLQKLEEERLRQEEEMRLKEEMERVRQLLEEREKEIIELKASKNRQNQAKAGFSCDDRTHIDEDNLESGPDPDSVHGSVPGDIIMERYLSSAPLAHSQSSVVSESFEHHSELDISADHRLEKCILCVCVFVSDF